MYKKGSWNAICDVCGVKFKADEMRKRWDGLMVCSKDFELDHPQKYLRVKQDQTSVPWVRNRPADVFINVCTLATASGRADFGTADCARADADTSLELIFTNLGLLYSGVSGVAIASIAVAGVDYV